MIKYKKVFKILVTFLLFPTYMFSQDITGLWKGELYNDTTKSYIPYELAISEEKGHYSAYSSTSFKVDSGYEIGIKEVSLKRDSDKITVVDLKLIFNNYSVAPPKGVKQKSIVTLQVKDTLMILDGTWSTNRTKQYLPLTGTILLHRRSDIKQSVLLKRLDSLNLTNNVSFITPKKTMPSTDSTIQKKKEEELARKKQEIEDKKKEELVKKQEEEKRKEQEALAKKEGQENKRAKEEREKEILAKQQETQKQKQEEDEAKKAAEQKQIAKEIAEKKIEEQKEALRKAQPAVDIDKRTTILQNNFSYTSDSLILTLYDNGEIDGDTVSVMLNGTLLFSKVGLNVKGNSKTIYINDQTPDSLVLTLYAENLGTIPPNTGLLVIHDGDKRYEAFFSADLKSNASVVLRRKKKEPLN